MFEVGSVGSELSHLRGLVGAADELAETGIAAQARGSARGAGQMRGGTQTGRRRGEYQLRVVAKLDRVAELLHGMVRIPAFQRHEGAVVMHVRVLGAECVRA